MAKTTPNQPHETTAFLDRGSHFQGTLTFQGMVRIDGVYQGDIVSGNHLVIGEKGEVEGTVNVEEVVISGHFSGTITATKNVVFHTTAVVKGEIISPRLTVDDGAVFNGSITMSSGKSLADRHGDPQGQAGGKTILTKG